MAEIALRSHLELENLYREYRQYVGLEYLETESASKALFLMSKYDDSTIVASSYKDSILGKAILRILRLQKAQSSSGTI
jgi:hypothetical protein